MSFIQIAIDGPAGAGKSSIAREVARELGYIYIDTGAMYRAVTYIAMQQGIAAKESEKIVKISEEIRLDFTVKNGIQHILANGIDVTEEIRLPSVSENVSQVSAISGVRRSMVKKQRELGLTSHVVMDGRDIGTVVFPEAEFKIFLTAQPETRAQRRKKELEEKGYQIDFEQLLEEIKKRDYMDENREDSPLVAADDAIIVDTTNLSFQDVLKEIKKIVRSDSDVL